MEYLDVDKPPMISFETNDNYLDQTFTAFSSLNSKDHSGIQLFNDTFDSSVSQSILSDNSEGLSNSLQLYPNPVKDLLNIQYNLEFRGSLSLHVVDGAGRRLKSVQQEGVFGPNATTLDVSDLKEGMYHLQMVHRGKRMHASFLKL